MKTFLDRILIMVFCVGLAGLVPVVCLAQEPDGELQELAAEAEETDGESGDTENGADRTVAAEAVVTEAVASSESEDAEAEPSLGMKLYDKDSISADYLISESAYQYDVMMYLKDYRATVTFRSLLGFGDGITDYTMLYTSNGTTAVLNKNLTMTGYTFKGWRLYSNTGKKVTKLTRKNLEEDFILYADFQPNTYKISYKKVKPAAGVKLKWKAKGSSETWNRSAILCDGKDISAPGYKLAGWYVEGRTEGEEGSYSNPYVPGRAMLNLAGSTKKDKKLILYPKWELE